MTEREELLALAERLDAWAVPVSSGQDAALAMRDAAKALRSAARTSPDVAGLREALRDVIDKGLIYWEPQTSRGATNKALMIARCEKLLAAPAGESVTVEEIASVISSHIDHGYEKATDLHPKIFGIDDASRALLSTFTITRKSEARS
jgi:hypothetical protein